jgi:hypothetical protein
MLSRLKSLFGRKTEAVSDPVPAVWPFDQPKNCGAITMRQVLSCEEPILLVSHDADDHGWQFIGSTDANVADGKLVCLEEAVRLDPSILPLADLPPGWQAVRNDRSEPWRRRPHPEDPSGQSAEPGSTDNSGASPLRV